MKLLLLVLVVFSGQTLFAQKTFKVQNASEKFDLSVRVVEDDVKDKLQSYVKGSAQINLYRKGKQHPFQILRLPNVIVSKDNTAFNPKINSKPRGLYAETYSFVFEDFNFDGNEDLAVWAGNNGGYGGPSYNVYLYKSGKFILNRKLSKLTKGVYLGLFFTELKKKHLVTFSKSGCCYHETETYKVTNNKPVMIAKDIEYFIGDDRFLETRKLVRGRWIKHTKKLKKEA
jgi:hypothetical protein